MSNKDSSNEVVSQIVPDGSSVGAVKIGNNSVAAGFPSPAQDYTSTQIDLNEHLISDKTSTYILRVSGDSMVRCGIFDGDEVIVDRGLEPRNNDIVVAIVDNEFTIKRLIFAPTCEIELHPENPNYPVLKFREGQEVTIWGVVTRCLHIPR